MPRKARVVKATEPTTKIIRDCRDGRADYTLPLSHARELYDQGRLHMDLTNGAYCHPENNSYQRKLV
jgi:hypothetical protein